METTGIQLIESWVAKTDGVHSIDEILRWITNLNAETNVSLKKISLDICANWLYDEEKGEIKHVNNIFFQVGGMRFLTNDCVKCEQPIILQYGIGYLGIICKEINGVIHFLMQAKIEPGNVNRIQISPTLQATLSNFTQQHGGAKPKYLEYFINADVHEIIVDQLQSEQSSRFLKKRNRNIIIKIECDIEIHSNFKWMTIGQIKELMKIDNIVNMDTRTVLSCIPFYATKHQQPSLFQDKALYNSLYNNNEPSLVKIFYYINNYKMYNQLSTERIPLLKLSNWKMIGKEFVCDHPNSYKVVFCDISIEGREVVNWCQPLIEAMGQAVFGLFTCIENDLRKFLVKGCHEVGCFDKIELGPTMFLEPVYSRNDLDYVECVFLDMLEQKKGIVYDVILSEEGGRFYHEQNRNAIIEIPIDTFNKLPDGYFWTDLKTLNLLTQFNNCLNIQLRNLLSLLGA